MLRSTVFRLWRQAVPSPNALLPDRAPLLPAAAADGETRGALRVGDGGVCIAVCGRPRFGQWLWLLPAALGIQFGMGLDLHDASISEAAETYPGVRFQVADVGEGGSLPEAQVAVCSPVLEHLSDPTGLADKSLGGQPPASPVVSESNVARIAAQSSLPKRLAAAPRATASAAGPRCAVVHRVSSDPACRWGEAARVPVGLDLAP